MAALGPRVNAVLTVPFVAGWLGVGYLVRSHCFTNLKKWVNKWPRSKMYHLNQCSNVMWNTACLAQQATQRIAWVCLSRYCSNSSTGSRPSLIIFVTLPDPGSGTESLRRCARLECLRSQLKNSYVLSCGYMCYENWKSSARFALNSAGCTP
jgi:hypothetical protein